MLRIEEVIFIQEVNVSSLEKDSVVNTTKQVIPITNILKSSFFQAGSENWNIEEVIS